MDINFSASLKIPPISLKNITLSGVISFARARVALSPLILTSCFSSVKPIGATTGMPPEFMIFFISPDLVSLISPTYPRSLLSIEHLKILPIMGIALTPFSERAEIILLFSPLKTSKATSNTSFEVTLWPSLKENDIFFLSSSSDNFGPPPWTIIGLKPTSFKKAKEETKLSRSF